MEPTTQTMLLLGLAALLALLLLVRAVGRRRSRGATAEAAATPEVAAVAEAEAEAQAEVVVEVEPETPVQAEPDVPAEVQAEVQAEVPAEVPVEVEPEVEAAADTVAPAARRRGLRRRARRDDVVAPPLEAEGVEPGAGSGDQAELRALREQLRELEQVVQQQAADHPTAALARVEEVAAQQSEAYLRQVSLVVRGLAAHTSEDENPRRTLARVAAAVERLGVPNQMERPILPTTRELSARPHQDGSANPSHRLEALEPGSAAGEAPVAPAPAPDVFAGLAAHPVAAPVEVPDHSGDVASAGYGAVSAPAQAVLTALYPEAVEPDPDGGLAAYQLSEAVLPVPPPATSEIPGRRRGLSRKPR